MLLDDVLEKVVYILFKLLGLENVLIERRQRECGVVVDGVRQVLDFSHAQPLLESAANIVHDQLRMAHDAHGPQEPRDVLVLIGGAARQQNAPRSAIPQCS